MKKIKLFSSIFTIAVGVTALLPVNSSAIDAPAKGSVGFTIPSNIDDTITIPETNPEITVKPPKGDGNGFQTGGGLAIIAPKYDFGTHEITQKDENFDVKVLKYDDEKDAGKSYYLPPMVIVKDLTGAEKGSWKVNLSASPFKNTSNHVLTGATIKFGGADSNQLFNNSKVNSSGVVDNTDQNVSKDGNFTLPVSLEVPADDTAVTIMTAKDGKGAGQTTLVPDTKANYESIKSKKGAHYKADDVVSGVQLFVPGNALRTTESAYVSDLTWTLTNA